MPTMFEEYLAKLREMEKACELVVFNCELAESFAKDAERYSQECSTLLSALTNIIDEHIYNLIGVLQG